MVAEVKKTKKIKQGGPKFHDHGTAVRIDRGEIEVTNNLARVTKKHPIDVYLDKGVISISQHTSGLKFIIDYAIAHENKSILSTIAELRGLIQGEENKITARDRHSRAIRWLSRTSYQIAWLVLIEGRALKEIKPIMGWFSSENTGTDRLREMLDDLDDFYQDLYRQQSEPQQFQQA